MQGQGGGVDRAWWEEGTGLLLQCDQGYVPSGSPALQCLAGAWSGPGLTLRCSFHSCGQLAVAEGEGVSYLAGREDWQAEAGISCREGWRGEQAVLRCGLEGWEGTRQGCVKQCGDPPQV